MPRTFAALFAELIEAKGAHFALGWMRCGNPALNGKAPIDVYGSPPDGSERVQALVDAMIARSAP